MIPLYLVVGTEEEEGSNMACPFGLFESLEEARECGKNVVRETYLHEGIFQYLLLIYIFEKYM